MVSFDREKEGLLQKGRRSTSLANNALVRFSVLCREEAEPRPVS